jgi:hypothetical protein
MKKLTRPVCILALRIAERAGVTEQIGRVSGQRPLDDPMLKQRLLVFGCSYLAWPGAWMA